jgi:hypothetical protein
LLTNEQIIAAIDAAEAAAFGPKSSEIASDRADAIDRYNGKTYGDEKAGRSAVVSRDVSDVVEGVAANVLKPFVGGDKVVVFNPRGPEDEEAAKQESDYVNFVVMERNNGFVCLEQRGQRRPPAAQWLSQVGWTKREDITIETYQGLSDEELALLADDKDIEIIGQREYPMFEVPQVIGMEQQPAPMLYDVKVHRKQPTEYVEIMPAPPDEILVSQRSTEPSVQNADFVQHRTHKTISELRELGYDVPDDLSDDQDNTESIEDLARNLFNAQSDQWADPTANAARRIVLFKESWLRIDKDGDGIAELRRVCSVGKNLLADEEADLIPIACFTPILMPHRHLGVSVYDLVKDIAEIKTAMLRSHLDNRYLQNNAEKVIDVNAIENIDDFLTSRPGGLKRVRGNPGEAVMPLVVPDNGAGALQTMEYLDSIRENRTGYTKAAEGMKSGSLATDTLGELNQQQSQSGIRLEMIARTIAETGLRDLFRIVHALTLKHSSRAEKVRLRNTWVEVNPRVGETDGYVHLCGPWVYDRPAADAEPDDDRAGAAAGHAAGDRDPGERLTTRFPSLRQPRASRIPTSSSPSPSKSRRWDRMVSRSIGPDGQPEMESAQMQMAQVKGQGGPADTDGSHAGRYADPAARGTGKGAVGAGEASDANAGR